MASGSSKLKVNYFSIYQSAAPFQVTGQSKNKGIITDVLESILPSEIELSYITYPFKRYQKALKGSKTHWITYGAPPWEGPQNWNLSRNSIMEVKHVFLSKKDFKFKRIEDLFGKRVVLLTGFSYPGLEKYIKLKKIFPIRVNGQLAAIAAIKKNRGVIFPEMKSRLMYHFKTNGLNLSEYKMIPASKYIKDYSIHLAFSKNFPQKLKDQIDKSIKKLKDNGKLRFLIRKYY